MVSEALEDGRWVAEGRISVRSEVSHLRLGEVGRFVGLPRGVEGLGLSYGLRGHVRFGGIEWLRWVSVQRTSESWAGTRRAADRWNFVRLDGAT